MQFQRDDEARIVLVTATGRVTAPDVIAALDRQGVQGTWSYAVLYDERAAHAGLSTADIRSIAAHVSKLSRVHGRRGPVAIVVSADLDYGINRMASAYASMAGYDIEVFRTIAAARDWIREKQ